MYVIYYIYLTIKEIYQLLLKKLKISIGPFPIPPHILIMSIVYTKFTAFACLLKCRKD